LVFLGWAFYVWGERVVFVGGVSGRFGGGVNVLGLWWIFWMWRRGFDVVF